MQIPPSWKETKLGPKKVVTAQNRKQPTSRISRHNWTRAEPLATSANFNPAKPSHKIASQRWRLSGGGDAQTTRPNSRRFAARQTNNHKPTSPNPAREIQKLKVLFAIQGYMDYPSEVSIPELHTMEQKEVPLFATFNNRILEVTETTPIQAQVRLMYYSGDQLLSFERNLPFKLFSRNTIRWDNKVRFASFVTPNDPPVIDFARGAAVPFAQAHRGAPLPDSILKEAQTTIATIK